MRNDEEKAVVRARQLRREMTALERGLWRLIRNEQIGFRFRRQYPVQPYYTLDFYCPSVKVCVEIDGPKHDVVKDAHRDRIVAEQGILTLRFSSREVFDDIAPVVEKIRIECEKRRLK